MVEGNSIQSIINNNSKDQSIISTVGNQGNIISQFKNDSKIYKLNMDLNEQLRNNSQ